MGLTLERLISNTAAITEVIRDEEADIKLLNDPSGVRAWADFSLHIAPRDLNFVFDGTGRLQREIS